MAAREKVIAAVDGQHLTNALEVGRAVVEGGRPGLRATGVDGHLKCAAGRGGPRETAMAIREAVARSDAPGGAAGVADAAPGARESREVTVGVAEADGVHGRAFDARRAERWVVAPVVAATGGEAAPWHDCATVGPPYVYFFAVAPGGGRLLPPLATPRRPQREFPLQPFVGTNLQLVHRRLREPSEEVPESLPAHSHLQRRLKESPLQLRDAVPVEAVVEPMQPRVVHRRLLERHERQALLELFRAPE